MAQCVMLVDDHPIVRGAIRSLIESISEDLQVRVAGSLAAAFEHLSADQPPDLAIVDLGLPDACGTATIDAFRRRATGIPVIAMSGYFDPATAAALRTAGAATLISKEFTAEEVKDTIRGVLKGGERNLHRGRTNHGHYLAAGQVPRSTTST